MERTTWALVFVTLRPFLGLFTGAVLRSFVPWLTTGLELVAEKQDWKAFPAFKPGYLASLALAVLGFVVLFITVPGLYQAFLGWEFVAAVGLAYSGQDLSRQVLKAGEAITKIRKRE